MIIKVQSINQSCQHQYPYSLQLSLYFLLSIVTISSFAQSDSNNSTNQTLENMSQSANLTGEHIQQDANQTSEVIQGNASDGDSNGTEGAKNIGNNLTEVAKKLGETISKKLHDLAK